MESKYKERAEKLLKFVEYSAKNTDGKYSYLVAMCELAEEVELETTRLCSDTGLDLLINQAKTMYTREQVEELLEKQRELSAEKAKFYGKNIDAPDLNEWELNNLLEEESYDITILIDTHSILNAKLKID